VHRGSAHVLTNHGNKPLSPTLLSDLVCLPCLTLKYLSLTLLKKLLIIHFQEIKSNKTVLHLAVKEGDIDLVTYLLRIPLLNIKDFVNLKVSPTLAQNSKLDFKYASVCGFM